MYKRCLQKYPHPRFPRRLQDTQRWLKSAKCEIASSDYPHVMLRLLYVHGCPQKYRLLLIGVSTPWLPRHWTMIDVCSVSSDAPRVASGYVSKRSTCLDKARGFLRYFHYLVAGDGGRTVMRDGWTMGTCWRGLLHFHLHIILFVPGLGPNVTVTVCPCSCLYSVTTLAGTPFCR